MKLNQIKTAKSPENSASVLIFWAFLATIIEWVYILIIKEKSDPYLHIYYSYGKAASEREALESRLDRMAAYLGRLEGQPVVIDKSYEKYYSHEYFHEGQEDQCFVCAIERSDVVEAELEMCRYFCIITSDKMTAKEALELYKSRDASEKLLKANLPYLLECFRSNIR